MDIKEQAIKKLTDEHKNGKYDRYGQVVKNEALKALTKFVNQDAEFAQAIVESSGTFSQCIEKAMKGCGSSISDIEVYRRCVQFYFKGATVDFKMEINLIGDAAAPKEAKSQTPGGRLRTPPGADEVSNKEWQSSQSGGELDKPLRCGNGNRGRLRPHPVADEVSNKEWQSSQSGGEAWGSPKDTKSAFGGSKERGDATDAVTATGKTSKKISLSLLDFI